ncbi:glutamate--cysteine ligase [Halomonas campisalis]|uniref:Glutamate--cysteine ligase n=1 Tax=Billgrantia campisalis TaxID=74661 RepID=A0ABS9P6Z5_9GAMM|nr:glutamate-cysteine ligase family protein [Halomonas campisalis]MCG6657561.1 glutamate--cysteine ligase [Halomonas campisalis]MDR5862665.1 glutamate-cysteine ligase family protein [Halomonas campisalis]
MGSNVERDEFTASEARLFDERLQTSLTVLQELLRQPGFGSGELSLGAELETYIADGDGHVLSINQQIMEDLQDTQMKPELNRFNIEYNLTPLPLPGQPLHALEQQLLQAIARLQEGAAAHQGRIISIGILPTLLPDELGEHAMTDLPRYRALEQSLRRLRGEEDFTVEIHGDDSIRVSSSHVVLEGANTSYQLHLRVEPERYADTFNTLQLVTPLVLAVAANSPLFLQRRLWDETRIALFKQSVDCRMRGTGRWRQPSRVTFGEGWVRRSAWELFAEAVALHPPIIPLNSDTPPEEWQPGTGPPALSELRMHMSTVWPWNRAVYDPAYGGHLRVEIRALPSGPTPCDMVANSALILGLVLGLRDEVNELLSAIPFRYAEYNFYRAAQSGLDARLLWPHRKHHRMVELPVVELLETLLPYARSGLRSAGVAGADCDPYLAIIRDRLAARTNGACWQRRVLERLEQRGASRYDACRLMLRHYCEAAASNRPVASWPTEV